MPRALVALPAKALAALQQATLQAGDWVDARAALARFGHLLSTATLPDVTLFANDLVGGQGSLTGLPEDSPGVTVYPLLGSVAVDISEARLRFLRSLGFAITDDKGLRLVRSRTDGADWDTPWHLDETDVRTIGGDGAGVRVGILDTRLERNCEEFRDRVVTYHEIRAGVREPVEGDVPAGQSHATSLAGLIAGSTVGVAPAAELVCVAAFLDPDGVSETKEQVVRGLHHLLELDVDVVNLSFSSEPDDRFLRTSLANVRVPVFAAIGNDTVAESPADYERVVGIGAVDREGRVWSTSGFGLRKENGRTWREPEFCAPGVSVRAPMLAGNWGGHTGTSIATAFVSGAAARLRSAGVPARRIVTELRKHLTLVRSEGYSGQGGLGRLQF